MEKKKSYPSNWGKNGNKVGIKERWITRLSREEHSKMKPVKRNKRDKILLTEFSVQNSAKKGKLKTLATKGLCARKVSKMNKVDNQKIGPQIRRTIYQD